MFEKDLDGVTSKAHPSQHKQVHKLTGGGGLVSGLGYHELAVLDRGHVRAALEVHQTRRQRVVSVCMGGGVEEKEGVVSELKRIKRRTWSTEAMCRRTI